MSNNEKPHTIWWVAHLFLGVVSGLVVYILYKDKNPAAAKQHLVFSIVIWVVLVAGWTVAGLLFGILLE